MKKLYTFLAAVLITASTFGQVPEQMSYQAVVRDAVGDLVTNQQVGCKLAFYKPQRQAQRYMYRRKHLPLMKMN